MSPLNIKICRDVDETKAMDNKHEKEDWYLDISDGLNEYLQASEDELEYTPPWIDEDLLAYSLNGIKTLK